MLNFSSGVNERYVLCKKHTSRHEAKDNSIKIDFDKLEAAEKALEGKRLKVPDEETDIVCELCGRKMVVKSGRFGKFLACPGFPECRNTKPYHEKAGVACPLCGEEVVILKTKKGRRYFGCENQECDFMSWSRPTKEKCPECGSFMVDKGSKLMCSKEGCGYSCNKKKN